MFKFINNNQIKLNNTGRYNSNSNQMSNSLGLHFSSGRILKLFQENCHHIKIKSVVEGPNPRPQLKVVYSSPNLISVTFCRLTYFKIEEMNSGNQRFFPPVEACTT